MLTDLELINYRGFAHHRLPLRDLTIAVGKNNAGKSTIIEALAILSIVLDRSTHLRFTSTPDWLTGVGSTRGIGFSLRNLDFEIRNICHHYRPPPAIIRAFFLDGSCVEVFLNPESESLFAAFRNALGRYLMQRSGVADSSFEIINVLPPVGRLQMHESLKTLEQVRQSLNTRESAAQFRNELYHFGEVSADRNEIKHDPDGPQTVTLMQAFSRLAESSWPHLKIEDVRPTPEYPRSLNFFIRDGAFVGEVGWAGHGLQSWLQICWFLVRCENFSTIVLDEPDVFLHADVQRKMVKLVKGYFDQVIIATHSLEILSEVDPEEVLLVDRDSSRSNFADGLPAVQSILDNIGGINNLQLTRLWSAKKCLFVEGDDLKYLNVFHEKLFEQSELALTSLPNISIGGFGNWRHAVGAAIGFRRVGDASIKAYCILDSDFRTQSENQKLKDDCARQGLNLHVWSRKEIENYVIVPQAIVRFINRANPNSSAVDSDVVQTIELLCETLKDETFDLIAQETQREFRASLQSANQLAREVMSSAWTSFEAKVAICSGKSLVSGLSRWAQATYGVSFGALTLARELEAAEISDEVKLVLRLIEEGIDFQSQSELPLVSTTQ